MKQQGAKEGEYRIIEEHTNAKICSIREIELQKEYNYPVDRIQYWKTLKIQKKSYTLQARKKAVANTDWVKRELNRMKSMDYSKLKKPVFQYNLNGYLIKEWDGFIDIKKELNYDQSLIRKCCKGLQKTAYGFIWKYKN
jgi:hypothetical protein